MYERHPDFKVPRETTSIWRYMDLAKFVSLVSRPALYFSAAAELGDPYEGALPKKAITDRKKTLGTAPGPGGLTADEMISNMRRASLRAVIVSCWHMSDDESAFMWDLYADKGIAVKTTMRRLRDSITDPQILFTIGKVRYIDYHRASLLSPDWRAPYMHKRKTYEVENELRAVAYRPVDRDWPEHGLALINRVGQDGYVDDGYRGRYVEVDLDELVERVVVAPGSRRGFLEDVRSAAAAFGLRAQVVDSSLDDPPEY